MSVPPGSRAAERRAGDRDVVVAAARERPRRRTASAAAASAAVRRSDLEQDDRVDDEEHGKEDRPAVEVALDERAAAERAAASADPERAREAGVLARVQKHEEDHDDRDQDLNDSENCLHGGGEFSRIPSAPRRSP